MGFLSSLFGGRPDSSEEIADIARRAAEREGKKGKRGVIQTFFGRTNPEFDKEISAKVRNDQREQYYENERQTHEQERKHQTEIRPRYIYDLEQSYRVPYYKEEVERLKREGSPYAAQMEEQLKYAQRSVDQHTHTFDHEHERQTYNQEYAFKQQQKDYASQVYDQAQKQKEQISEQMKRRQASQQALHTGSNVGRGGNAGRTLGQGNRFSSFNPIKSSGNAGRRSRSSFTSPGR